MEINGKDDYFARWLQGLCAIPLFGGVLVVIWLLKHQDPAARPDYDQIEWLWGLLVGLNILLVRCLWYAFVGTGNVNRDVMNETNVGGDRLMGDD